jgi:hypothetical protein
MLTVTLLAAIIVAASAAAPVPPTFPDQYSFGNELNELLDLISDEDYVSIPITLHLMTLYPFRSPILVV